MSRKRLFCDAWEFVKTPLGSEYPKKGDWMAVDLPHDWLIYDARNLYETSTGWYRRRLDWEKKDGVRTAIRFEGVYMDSRTYVNGVLVGEWKYGYSTFEFDITEFLKDGENEISVRVDYQEPNSRWYSGAGIYRKVWLKEYPDCHLASDGIYLSANELGEIVISAETERPMGVGVAGFALRHTIRDGESVLVSSEAACCACDLSRIPQPVRREGFSYSSNTVTLQVKHPVLWDLTNPKRYTCVTELLYQGEVIDREENDFGFRRAEFTCDRGFLLNGTQVKLHGCCEHHDLGALGAAVNKAALRRKLVTLRGMGINAIRTSHNMPAVELMELTDEMGFLILSEGFDMWERPKTEYDYARFFPEWVARDVASWVRRDRNHPSLIGWSVGNEIYDTHADDRGQEVASLLYGLVREHDPRANGYVTIGSNYMQWENAQKCADIVKLAGYNYAERLYEEHHKKHPDWMIYGSETASVVQSRGIYHFPLSQSVLSDDDEQCSALGNSTTGWGAANTEACIIPDRDSEFCAGQFIWTGFDYIGEPTPYDTKNSYFGQFDTAGFAKDSAYIFRAEWTKAEEAPFVHIFPYWDFIKGQQVDVRVTTNAPKVKLYFNGSLIAEKDIDHLHGTELTLDTSLVYQPGELLAIACDKTGRELARDVQRSFGNTATLQLIPDKMKMLADGEDLIFLEINALDENGTFVANANNRVRVSVTGAGRLVGLDNGDSTDYEQYKGTSRRLFSGKLLAIIAAKLEPGEIHVTVSSPGLCDASVTLVATEAKPTAGISAAQENQPCEAECGDEACDIPVRKIDFCYETCLFTPEKKELTFQTVLAPQNTSYANDIEYRITTVLGIPSNLAEITSVENGRVTVVCQGDGEFYLRALCKNGTQKYHLVTSLALKGEGIGAASFDPYTFVVGGLYDLSNGKAGNGIERGASFASENSWFGFAKVDFGKIGSDTVTVPIYANCTTPVHIRFYDGIPNEGGELIGDFVYHEPPTWLTYKPNTFRLSKRLTGMHTFVMESADGYHVKGFQFERPEKESAVILAAANEGIYGDKFTEEAETVTGIGNNVILEFGKFEFKKAPAKVIITGRSKLPLNSIHIIFTGEDGSKTRVLAEFERAEDYTAREFKLEGIEGKGNVSFAFLPGSNFDFASFQFVTE